MVVRDAHKKGPRLTRRPRLPHPAAQAPTYERLLRPYVLMEPRNTKKGELAALARGVAHSQSKTAFRVAAAGVKRSVTS
jgi:hypothetical protein